MRLHTVGFGLARAGGPIASLCAEWPKASILCCSQVTRVRIDGGVVQSLISQGPTVINISSCKKLKKKKLKKIDEIF